MKKCRVAILGGGRIGKLHAENIYRQLPQFILAGIADPYAPLDWAHSLNIPLITTDSDALIQDSEIDAIIIASPALQHVPQAIAASEMGKAVFCEKPLGLKEADILSCMATIEKNETLLQVGFNRRFDPNFLNVQNRHHNYVQHHNIQIFYQNSIFCLNKHLQIGHPEHPLNIN